MSNLEPSPFARLGPRAACMQISSKNKKKNHVNENLEKTPKHVILTERTHPC